MKKYMIIIMLTICFSEYSVSQTINEYVKANDIENVRKLVENDHELINFRDNIGRTPLHWSARGVHTEIMRFLIDKGADLNAKDNNGICPIVSVVARNHNEAVKLLLDSGASTLITDNEGTYPIHISAQYGFVDIVKMLYEKDTFLEIKDGYGRTPLIVACREGGDINTVSYLISIGANVNAIDKNGGTPLLLSAWRGYKDVVNLLIDSGAAENIQGKEAEKLLRYACDKHLYSLYNKLILDGFNIKFTDENNQTAMHWAAMGGSDDIIIDMIDGNMEINNQDIYTWTPLHYAAYFGRDTVVELLLNNGADINCKTVWGETPLFIAQNNGHHKIIEHLTVKNAEVERMYTDIVSGKYFGCDLPGNTAELFAPGIVSRLKGGHSNITFSPDGTIALWTEWNLTETGYSDGSKIFISRNINGNWTYPKVLIPKGDCPFFSVDGRRIYFRATLPDEKGNPKPAIWYYNISDTAFSYPKQLDFDVVKHQQYWQYSIDGKGNLYFGGSKGLSRSLLVDGEYQEPEKLSEVLNSKYSGGSPYISPDGNYLIFSTSDLPDTHGKGDLYIGRKNKDRTWSDPVNLGKGINSSDTEILPMVSADGKFLFFKSSFGNIMWVSTDFLQYL